MRKAAHARREKRSKRRYSFVVWLFPLIALSFIALTIMWLLRTRLWDGEHRLSIAVIKPTGDVLLHVYDPNTEALTILRIPSSVQMTVANQLGQWQLKSILQLGQQEKLGGGALVADSIIKSFHIPVDGWIVERSKDTNLTWGDRIRMSYLALKVPKTRKNTIDLSETVLLKNVMLLGGEMGYSISLPVPDDISRLFALPTDGLQGIRLAVVNKTGNDSIPSEIPEILEILGAKIISVQKDTPEDIRCQVRGNRDQIMRWIATTLRCQISKAAPTGNFEIELHLGEKFLREF